MSYWREWGYGLALGLAFIVGAALAPVSCATAGCSGDVTALPCTCPAQQNPGCYPPLTDRRAPDGGGR